MPGSLRQSTIARTKLIAAGSIAVAIVVLGLKYAAYALTGSVALYSDAIESIVNLATAIIALFAVSLSAIPADEGHPFGHSKVEYLSAVVVGVLIVIAALSILREAYYGFLDPRPLDAPMLGLSINAAAGVLNAIWAYFLISHGRAIRSPALAADGRHLMSDVVTSAGVVAGVAVAYLTGIAALDPLIAALVAVHILWTGWGLMKESVGGLMDVSVSQEELARIQTIIASAAEGAIEAHDLRTRRAGPTTFIEFHLVVASAMSVSDAHDICDRLERALIAEFDNARVTIHVEPENKAKHAGVLIG